MTGGSDFPLKFCTHMWLDNSPVSSLAITVWDSVKAYVTAADQKKVSCPTNQSYTVVRNATKDPLILAKLAFFNSLGREIEPFLALYQTDKVMVSFLASYLEKVMRNIMGRFIKDDVLEAAKTSSELLKIDLSHNLLANKKNTGWL